MRYTEGSSALVSYPGRLWSYENFSLDEDSAWLNFVADHAKTVNLVLGGLGAHVAGLDKSETLFPSRLQAHLGELQRILSQAKGLREKGLVGTQALFT